jgi:hypothetical protein
VTFEQGLSDTVAWYASHRDWWEPLMGGSPVEEGTAWEEPAWEDPAPPGLGAPGFAGPTPEG